MPRSFKGVDIMNHLINYYNQKGAWITQDISENWFKHKFVSSVRSFLKEKGQPQKCVLLLDNVPKHPNEVVLTPDDGLITPLDQGVIELMKHHYQSVF
ncbi:hypothetical protein PR048_019572 [Dryococelus australis]|uniref:DDE-1 domain-containing protein n=1 Tax=Dryococelus australis TaxID=614101 RepID=A0ABQ9H3U4_9NEOP|nr:hypothetical protein PR048_019572 [Dryococelus australis]